MAYGNGAVTVEDGKRLGESTQRPGRTSQKIDLAAWSLAKLNLAA